MANKMEFGKEGGLRATLEWTGKRTGTAAEVTRGALLLEIGDKVIWAGETIETGFEWTWIELLEFLAHSWPWLQHEQALPFGLHGTAAQLHGRLMQRWDDLPEHVKIAEQKTELAFYYSHNLAGAVQGAWPEAVWILRRGRLCEIDAEGATWLLQADDVFGVLKGLGDAIADRAQLADDGRSRPAIALWREGRKLTADQLLQAETGWSAGMLQALGGAERAAAMFAWVPGAEETPQLAAARMAGTFIEPDDQRRIASAIGGIPAFQTPTLDGWAAQLQAFHDIAEPRKAFHLGRDAAAAFRAILGNEEEPINPRKLLKQAGVYVGKIALNSRRLDAVATWGGGHGPAVLVGKSSPRNASRPGLRSTLAHEIAHLLLDRDGALPLAEVMGGETAPGVEPRASAFAAELLVPRRAVRACWSHAPDVASAHKTLQRRYGASAEVVAWQIRRTDVTLSEAESTYLRQFVSNPHRF